jgi:hypothetical protein
MSRELQNRLNLFARHAEFFHQLVNAHILKVLEHSGDRRPSAFKHPRTAALAGDAQLFVTVRWRHHARLDDAVSPVFPRPGRQSTVIL